MWDFDEGSGGALEPHGGVGGDSDVDDDDDDEDADVDADGAQSAELRAGRFLVRQAKRRYSR